MTMGALLKKLAVERCMHNLAQISVVLHLAGREDICEGMSTATCRFLIESIQHDLGLLDDGLEDAF